MFLNGAVANENQVLDAWNNCFIQAGWTMVTGGARHPDNNTVGVDWTTSNAAYGNANTPYRTYSVYRPVIIPVLPVYQPPMKLSIGNLEKGFMLGQRFVNSETNINLVVNNFSYPATWTCHYDTTTKEFYWQMNDGINVNWFACGIDTVTLKNPEATGFWLWSNGARNNAYGYFITHNWSAYPTPLYSYGFSSDSNNTFQESDNLPGGLTYNNYYDALLYTNVDYGAHSNEGLFDARYRLWPVRYFKRYRPVTLTSSQIYLIWQAQTIKSYRSWDLNIGDSFSVGMDTYCWYSTFRRNPEWVDNEANMIGYNITTSIDPKTGNLGIAVKKTT
jgi:hypothetical protein